jgi:hypothetical protein
MDLHAKSYETYGADTVKAIKDSISGSIDLKTLSSILEKSLKATGWETKMIVESPHSVVLRHSRCPECEGLFQAGLDPGTVKAHCERSVRAVTPYLRELVPGIRLDVRKWDAPKTCDEELVLE